MSSASLLRQQIGMFCQSSKQHNRQLLQEPSGCALERISPYELINYKGIFIMPLLCPFITLMAHKQW